MTGTLLVKADGTSCGASIVKTSADCPREAPRCQRILSTPTQISFDPGEIVDASGRLFSGAALHDEKSLTVPLADPSAPPVIPKWQKSTEKPRRILLARYEEADQKLQRRLVRNVAARYDNRLMPASDEGATQPPPEPTLLELARKKFATFSPAEEELFRAAQEGRGVSRLTGDEKEDNPGNAANWDADRIVRGECIAWLCTDTQASALVTYRGLELYGMRIDADVNLNDAEIKFPLKAWMCAFSGDVLLQNAQLKGLYLLGCLLKSLNAGGANIRGAVLLCDEFEAEGEVNLMRATIDGNLECDGQLSNPKGRALSADGTKIGGSVFLKNGFKAEGEVNLLGTTIGGDLDCKGAQLSNPKGRALNANRTKIGGSVFLNDGFQAEGEVNLWGATIEGELDCAGGARLSNAEGNALSADGINIGGSVFLRDGFGAEGEVNLAGTTIDGNLECDGQLSNAKGWALRADGIKIGSSVFLRDGFQAEGEVNLTGAAIDGDLDCAGAQLSNAKGWALSAGRMKVGGSVFLRNGFRAEGEVRLAGATINVTLDCAKAQ